MKRRAVSDGMKQDYRNCMIDLGASEKYLFRK